MLVSSAAFAVMYVLAKDLTVYGGYQTTFFRGLGTFVIALGYLLAKGISPLGNRPRWLFARGITGAVSLLLFFLALEYVPVTGAVAVRYLSPFFAIAIVAVALGERVRPIQWFYLLVAFAGVVLAKGFDPRFTLLGFGLILGSAVLGGVTLALVRMIGTTEHPLVIVCYFTGLATLLGALGMWASPRGYTPPAAADWLPLIGLGVVGFVGQIFMTVALQREPASRVMPLKYVETVFLLLLGYAFLGETYGVWALVGMLLILVGNVLNVVEGRS